MLPTDVPGKHYQGDVTNILDQGWDMMVAFPPCTHLAVSGARWFKEKRADGRQQAALGFVQLLMDGLAAVSPLATFEEPYDWESFFRLTSPVE
jgi:hypothetical protein